MAKKVVVRLLGVEQVMNNLRKEIQKIKNYSMKGLIQSAIVIRRDMDKVPPKIPLDWGNLRQSWFTTTGYGNSANDSGNFKGDDAGTLSGDHASVVSTASGQATSVSKTSKPILILGFSAHYAPYVHEMGEGVAWKRPGSGPKFFESALKNNEKTIIELIKANAKLK